MKAIKNLDGVGYSGWFVGTLSGEPPDWHLMRCLNTQAMERTVIGLHRGMEEFESYGRAEVLLRWLRFHNHADAAIELRSLLEGLLFSFRDFKGKIPDSLRSYRIHEELEKRASLRGTCVEIERDLEWARFSEDFWDEEEEKSDGLREICYGLSDKLDRALPFLNQLAVTLQEELEIAPSAARRPRPRRPAARARQSRARALDRASILEELRRQQSERRTVLAKRLLALGPRQQRRELKKLGCRPVENRSHTLRIPGKTAEELGLS